MTEHTDAITAKPGPRSSLRVQVLLYDGCDELDAIAPFEVLQMAARLTGFRVELVTQDGAEEVTASKGLKVRPGGGRLSVEGRPDVLVVPGGNWIDRGPSGARAEAERGVIPAMLAELHRAGTVLAAVCTGAMLLSAAGLLKGRPAVTHHGALEELRAQGAVVVRARVVDDGDVITAGGITSGLDLALWLVERFAGAEVAHAVEQRLEYERRGVVWRRRSGA
jgi:transcriptional regulator GlxA family with amidase domain